MTWLYNKNTSAAQLFHTEEEAEAALESGEWEDTPAKCNGEHSSTGPGIGEIAIEDYQGLTIEDFVSRFTKDEMKVIAKELKINISGRKTEESIAKALVEALTKPADDAGEGEE